MKLTRVFRSISRYAKCLQYFARENHIVNILLGFCVHHLRMNEEMNKNPRSVLSLNQRKKEINFESSTCITLLNTLSISQQTNFSYLVKIPFKKQKLKEQNFSHSVPSRNSLFIWKAFTLTKSHWEANNEYEEWINFDHRGKMNKWPLQKKFL